MTQSDPAVRAPAPAPEPVTARGDGGRRRRILTDVAVVFGVLLALGVLGGVVWRQVADLPRAMLVEGKVVIVPDDLAAQIGIDGWYALIALGGGLGAGLVLTAWRRTDPLLTVAAVTLAACLAGWVMQTLGRALGPGDPAEALRAGSTRARAPVELVLHAPGALWLWPVAAAAGCLVWLYLASGPPAESGRKTRNAAGRSS